MKRINHLFLCILLALIGQGIAQKALASVKYAMEDARLLSTEVQDGDLLVFEAASTTANYGYYVKESEGTYKWSEGFDNTAVWQVIATGKKSSRYTTYDTYYLKNASTGNYLMSGNLLTTSANVADATEFVFFMKGDAPYSYGNYSNQTTYPKGWDENSWTVYDVVDFWWRNDGGQKASGTLSGSGTHNYMWNVKKAYDVNKVVPKAKLMDIVFNADGTATDVSPMHHNVVAFGPNVPTANEYNETYGKYVATFRDVWGAKAANYVYKIDYSTNTAFIDGLKNGHTLEATFCSRVDPTTNLEAKWSSSTSQGGTTLMAATTSYGAKIGGEITFNPNVSPSGTNSWKWATSGVQIQKDVFYHVVGVWDKEAGVAKVYVNGVLKNTVPAEGILRLAGNGTNAGLLWWCIGANPAGASSVNSAGSWDIVTSRIYDDPLTDEQVALLWEQERPKAELPKADLLDVIFNEGTGATDVSESNYTVTTKGTIVNKYDAHFQKYIADIDNGTKYATTVTNYYQIPFSKTVSNPILDNLPNGYSFESVVSAADVKTTTSEAKWFGSTSSGGNALMLKNGKIGFTSYIVNGSGGNGYKWANKKNANGTTGDLGVFVPEKNQYYHVVSIWDKEKGEIRIYVNGQYIDKCTNADGDLKFGAEGFGIGANSGGAGGASWKIATQRIYSNVLTDVEISELYNSVSTGMEAANAYQELKELVAAEKLIDYDSDPTVIQSTLVPYKTALQAAEQVIAEIDAKTSGNGLTAEEYLAMTQALADAKDKIASAPVADVLDAQFNVDGTATDLSTMNNTIERRGEDNIVEYSKVFGKNIAKFNADYAAAPNNYYKVDYSSQTDGAMLEALKSGHTLETVFCLREGEITNVEAKWFSAMQSGGTGMMICTASHGKDGSGNEITFLPNVGGYKYAVSGITPEVGKYYHTIGVWDNVAGKARIYINGELLNEVDAAGTWAVPGDASRWFCIGGDPTSDNAEQGGSWNVATARIYDNPLTSGQVEYLWNQQKQAVLLATPYERLERLVNSFGDNDYEAAAAGNPQIAAFVAVLDEAKAMIAAEELKTVEEYTDMAARLQTAYDNIAIGKDITYFNDLSVKEGSYVKLKSAQLAPGDKVKLTDGENSYTLNLTMVDDGAKYFIPADFETGNYTMSLIRDNITYASFGSIKLEVVEQLPAGSRPVAHRGFYNDTPVAPQNSRQSFRNALREGFVASETDVWMTTDNHIFINHDASIGGKTIQTSTAADLATVKLSNGETVPELKDFLDILRDEYPDSPCKLQIEIKYNTSSTNTLEMCAAIVALVKEYGLEDRVNYISYSMPACQKILECNPNADVAFLAGSSAQLAPDVLITYGDMSFDYDHTVIKAHPEYITRAAELGINSVIYTVDLESQLLTYNKMGIDFIATNHPDLAREIYEYYQDNVKATTKVDDEGVATIDFQGKINPDMYIKAMTEATEDFAIVDLRNAQPSRDLTYATLTSVAKTANTLYYLPANTRLANENNVVVEGTCANLVITDKESFAPNGTFTATTATYSRTLEGAGWNTAVLPYDIVVPEGVTVLNNAVLGAGTITFSSVEEGETIAANTPFVYKSDNSSVTFATTNATINAEPLSSGALLGTYTTIKAGEATGKVILNSDGSAFATASALATIPAFRAYLNGGSSSGNFVIIVDDDPTGLLSVGNNANLNQKVDVYTADGKLVRSQVDAITALQGLASGTYVVGGYKIKK